MSFGGGSKGPSEAEMQRQAEQAAARQRAADAKAQQEAAAKAEAARVAEEARLAQLQKDKEAQALQNTLSQKASQAASEAGVAAQRQSFIQGVARTALGTAEDETLAKKKTLLANYAK